MSKFIEDPATRPAWGYVFVCESKRCVDERVAELKTLERQFPYYQYNYKCQKIDSKYVIRLISVTAR